MSDAPTILQSGGLERIYDGIEAVLPGVMHPVVQMCMFDAIEEFCTKSTFWRGLFAWEMAPGQVKLDLNPPGVSPIVRWVLNVSGLRCHRIAPTAVLVDMGSPNEIALARSGTVWAACTPTDIETLPDWISDWSEAIRAGVLFRLYSQPKKPYSDLKQAPFYGKVFRQQITLAKIEAQKLCAHDAWHYPYFARGREGFWGGWGRWNDGCLLNPPFVDTRGGTTTVIIPPPPPTPPALTISVGVITTVAAPPPTAVFGLGTISVVRGTVGAGVAAYTLSASSLTFPTEPTATPSPTETITVTNTGTVPLTITSATTSGDFAITGLSTP